MLDLPIYNLNIPTGRTKQIAKTVQTGPEEQSDQGLHQLQFHYILDTSSSSQINLLKF